MNYNKIIIIVSIILIVVILTFETHNQINNNHYKRLYDVEVAKIKEVALDCYRKNICENKLITLEKLYKEKLLEYVINPKINDYFNEESYVIINKNNTYLCDFVELNN